MLKKIKNKIFNPSQHFQIRYNTLAGDGDLVWRIITENGEKLASSLSISGYIYGEKSFVDGERKMNIAGDGNIYWHGTHVEIFAGKRPEILS